MQFAKAAHDGHKGLWNLHDHAWTQTQQGLDGLQNETD